MEPVNLGDAVVQIGETVVGIGFVGLAIVYFVGIIQTFRKPPK